jgi:hypothetical protein
MRLSKNTYIYVPPLPGVASQCTWTWKSEGYGVGSSFFLSFCNICTAPPPPAVGVGLGEPPGLEHGEEVGRVFHQLASPAQL